jgi:hypothetical protein
MTEAISTGRAASADRTWLSWGVGAIVAALVADVLFNTNVSKGENGGTGPMLGVGAILIVVGAVLYLAVFPRVTAAARGALVTGIVTLLSLGVFWSAAPILLAVATYVFFRRASDATPARIGMALAALAALLDVVAAVGSAVT